MFMRFLLLVLFVPLYLFASSSTYPKAYNTLGDKIYANVTKIERLKSIDALNELHHTIDRYLKEVQQTKALGFKVDSKERDNVRLEYLAYLRKHKKSYEFFLHRVRSAYELAKKEKNYKLFETLVQVDLLDRREYKQDILEYYHRYSRYIEPQSVLQEFLDEEALRKKKKYKPKTKQQMQEEKLRRIRHNDQLEREALEKRLEKELREKKEAIRKNQEKELFN